MNFFKSKLFWIIILPIMMLVVGAILIAIFIKKKSNKTNTNLLTVTFVPSYYMSVPYLENQWYINTYRLVEVTKNVISTTNVEVIVKLLQYALPSLTVVDRSVSYNPKQILVKYTVDPTDPSVNVPNYVDVEDVPDLLQFEFTTSNVLVVSLHVQESNSDISPLVQQETNLPSFSASDIQKLVSNYLSDGDKPPDCSQITSYQFSCYQAPDIDEDSYPGWSLITLYLDIQWTTTSVVDSDESCTYLNACCPSSSTIDTRNEEMKQTLKILANRGQNSTNGDILLVQIPRLIDGIPIFAPVEGFKECCSLGYTYFPNFQFFFSRGYMYISYKTTNPLQLSFGVKINCSSDTQDCS